MLNWLKSQVKEPRDQLFCVRNQTKQGISFSTQSDLEYMMIEKIPKGHIYNFVLKIFTHSQYEKSRRHQQHLTNINNELSELLKRLCRWREQVDTAINTTSLEEKEIRYSLCDFVSFQKSDDFIVNQLFHFQSEIHTILSLEYFLGRELYSLINQVGSLEIYQSRFYIANVIQGLKSLHSLKILYRELSDMGLSIIMSQDTEESSLGSESQIQYNKSSSLLFEESDYGTFEYMPPECFQEKRFGFAGDWWALGCPAYEMATGSPPFYGLDHKRLTSKILYTEPDYKQIKDQTFKDFIQKFLVKDSLPRLQNALAITCHPLFADFDWVQLSNKRLAHNPSVFQNYNQQRLKYTAP